MYEKNKNNIFLTPLLVSFSNGSQLNFLPSLNSKLEELEIYKIVYSERKTEKLLTNNNSEFASAEINLDVIRTSCSGPYSNKKESITLFYRTLFHLNASCTYKNGMFWWFTSDQPFTNIKEVNISTTLDRYNKSEFICGPNELLTTKKQNDVYYVTMGDSELHENISFNGIEFDGHKDKTINGISYTYPYYIKYYDKTYKDYILNNNGLDKTKPSKQIASYSTKITDKNNQIDVSTIANYHCSIEYPRDTTEYFSQDRISIYKGENKRVHEDVYVYGALTLPYKAGKHNIKITPKTHFEIGSMRVGDGFTYDYEKEYHFVLNL